MQNIQNPRKLFVQLTKIDQFLDLSYYKQEITFWDKDKELTPSMSAFNIGYVLLNLFQKLDNLGEDIEVEIKIKNAVLDLTKLKIITGQTDSKSGKLQLCRELTSSEKEAIALRKYLKVYNCWFS